jgi:hypothetical protein
MNSRTNNNYPRPKSKGISFFNIPIESIRKTRCLNIDKGSSYISWEVYKILKSNNGRKLFA